MYVKYFLDIYYTGLAILLGGGSTFYSYFVELTNYWILSFTFVVDSIKFWVDFVILSLPEINPFLILSA